MMEQLKITRCPTPPLMRRAEDLVVDQGRVRDVGVRPGDDVSRTRGGGRRLDDDVGPLDRAHRVLGAGQVGLDPADARMLERRAVVVDADDLERRVGGEALRTVPADEPGRPADHDPPRLAALLRHRLLPLPRLSARRRSAAPCR